MKYLCIVVVAVLWTETASAQGFATGLMFGRSSCPRPEHHTCEMLNERGCKESEKFCYWQNDKCLAK